MDGKDRVVMAPRSNRARSFYQTEILGSPQLILAQLIVNLENIVSNFARPLLAAAVFVVLAWFGVFASLYPWLHIVALIGFTCYFFSAFGKARLAWKPAGMAYAKRRVEEASHLEHRPLDVFEDRPATLNAEQIEVWQ